MRSGSVKKWILVVDDEPDIVDILLHLLEMNFADIAKFVSARDGMDATTRLNFQAFDLIITDMKMPKRDGNAFIDSIKNNPLNMNAPIIVLSGDPNYAHKEKYPDLKILEKPIDTPELLKLVKQELKLGKTDQRIEAGLLNGFVSGFTKFFKDLFGEKIEQQSPLLKMAHHEVPDELLYFIRVQSGKVMTSFLFGFEKQTVQALGEKVSGGGDVDIAKTLDVAGGIILQNAFKEVSSTDLHVLSKTPVHDRSDKEFGETMTLVKKEKGIVIPLIFEMGKINIYVLW